MANNNLTTHSTASSAVYFKQEKFDWTSSEGAPPDYPMQLISGSFFLADGNSLYIPDGATLYYKDWGMGHSNHIVGPDLKALPNRLAVTFFSYTENKFYSGDFELPYARILALFQQGHYSRKHKEDITYDEIVVGVAPGGVVSVWLTSLDRTVEVFFGYANEVEGNWASINDNPKYTREEYVRLEIEDTLKPEQIAKMKKNGIPLGLWERYHKARYSWQPAFVDMVIKDNRISYIRYRNGERDFIDLDPVQLSQHPSRAVPDTIYFVWQRADAKPLFLNVYFKDHSLLEAFEELSQANLPLTLQMQVKKNKDNKDHFYVTLKNNKASIDIPHKLEVYDVPNKD